jgi:hypothetical protein
LNGRAGDALLLMTRLLLPLAILFGLSPQPSPTAVGEFARLQQQAHAARVSGDKQAALQAALKVQKLLNDASDATEATAQAYADAGDPEHALAALNRFADLGQADDDMLSGKTHLFAALEKLPEYQSILQRFAENKTPISRAEMAFALTDPGILAEDIDYDPQSKSFLITSVLEKKIVRITTQGKAMDFAQSPSHWPMLALKADANRNLLWATEVAMDAFIAAPKSDWGRSAVLCFDLRTGALRRRIESPAHSALGDMALTPRGDPIVSDGDGGGVYRVAGDRLERMDGGDFISPQTPAMLPNGDQLLIPDYARGIGVLHPASKRVSWLQEGAPAKYALNGIDGLYFDRGSLIATQNGTSPERVIRFQLNSTLTAIVSEQIVERATATLGDPTHGVIVGDFFYYIANSGWTELDEHGALKAGSKLTPARIMRFRL